MSEIVVCAIMPRFRLIVAAGDRAELLRTPVAIAPDPGAAQQIGETSPSAEAFGLHEGMRLGEALSRCPRLMLVPGDPAGVADRWERVLVSLEGIGASVESECPGIVHFDARGLLSLHGGRLSGVLDASRRALAAPARFGVAPTRFTAFAAGQQGPDPATNRDRERTGGTRVPRLPAVTLLRQRPTMTELPEALERLGITTLGAFARLSRHAVADRFGARRARGPRTRRGTGFAAAAEGRLRTCAAVAGAPRGCLRHAA